MAEETTEEQTPAPVADSDDNADSAPATADADNSSAKPAGGETPESKLFVGGLSWGTTDEALKAAFVEFGTVVSAEVIKDKMTGRSKGFGFVVMGSPEEAQAAVAKLNGQTLDGRQVTVNVARPKTDRPRNFGDGDRPHRSYDR